MCDCLSVFSSLRKGEEKDFPMDNCIFEDPEAKAAAKACFSVD